MGHYDNCRDGYCAVCGQVAVQGTPYCKGHQVKKCEHGTTPASACKHCEEENAST